MLPPSFSTGGFMDQFLDGAGGLLTIVVLIAVVIIFSGTGRDIPAKIKEMLNRNKQLKQERKDIEAHAKEQADQVKEDLQDATTQDIIDRFHDAFGGNDADGADKPDGSR
jgi:Sec-independent protein translocase protein TatA